MFFHVPPTFIFANPIYFTSVYLIVVDELEDVVCGVFHVPPTLSLIVFDDFHVPPLLSFNVGPVVVVVVYPLVEDVRVPVDEDVRVPVEDDDWGYPHVFSLDDEQLFEHPVQDPEHPVAHDEAHPVQLILHP